MIPPLTLSIHWLGVVHNKDVLLEHGWLEKYVSTGTPTKWQTLAIDDTFTQEDINLGRVRYKHNGSETTEDRFDFKVDDGNEDGSDPVTQEFYITITPVNDQPTLTGDNAVTKDDAGAKEGETYVFTVDDLGWADPDDDPVNVTYIIRDLPDPATQGTLLINGVAAVASTLNASGEITTNGTTFTLADLIARKVQFKHLGDKPVSTTFTYVVEDDGNNGANGQPDGTGVVKSAVQTVTLEFKEVNDTPKRPDLGISRIDPLAAPGATVATLDQQTDEETTTQTDFTYALVAEGHADYEDDNAYFVFNGRELKFKSDAALKAAGLELKLEDDTDSSYSISLTVTDTAAGNDPRTTDPDLRAKTRPPETYTIPVRSFDVDWNTSTPGVQNAPTIAVDLRTNEITVGTDAAIDLFDR